MDTNDTKFDRPGCLADIAGSYLREIDAAVGRGKEMLAVRRKKVSCHAGCAHCCKLPLSATRPEAEHAAAFIHGAYTSQMLAELIKHGDAWIAWHEDVLPDYVRGGLDEADAYAMHGPGCPFLSGGLCNIYPARPMGCRVHLSTEAPELCRPGTDYEGLDDIPGTVMEALIEVKPLCMGYRRTLEDAGLDFSASVAPFARMVLEILKG